MTTELNARDVMTEDVLAVAPNDSVGEVAKVLVENRISAVPVIDLSRGILGVVSEGDLLRRMEDECEKHPSWWLSMVAEAVELDVEVVRFRSFRARDIMTSPAITVMETTSLEEVAELLVRRRIKRVPVMRNSEVVGVISRTDVLRGLAGLSLGRPQPSA